MPAPDQYGRNVATTGTGERVEYAIKLPGHDSNGTPVWLPIDAKFPVEDYQRLVDASERADVDGVEKASRQLEATLKLCAKCLSDKYIAPPATTDFGILFLSTEGLYAEAMRRAGLAEFIQREYRIVLSGPSTLAALLNSFQIRLDHVSKHVSSKAVARVLSKAVVSSKAEHLTPDTNAEYTSDWHHVKLPKNDIENRFAYRDLYSGLIRLHILHHAVEGPIFGLEMAEELARHGYQISLGTLYPLLHGMESKGYLRSYEKRNGKSIRKVYRATPLGKKALGAMRVKVSELFGELNEAK